MHLVGLIYLNVWWCTDLQTLKFYLIWQYMKIGVCYKMASFDSVDVENAGLLEYYK
jgi:hypothetical protein